MIVKQKQTIFDVALIAYQDASRVYDLIASNPEIDNINSDLTGLDVMFTPSVVTQKEAVKTLVAQKKVVTISSTQTLFDIALQYGGAAENVYNIVLDNGLDSIMSDPTGINLNYTLNNTYVPLYFRKNNKNIATKPLARTQNTETFYRVTADGDLRITTDGDNRIYG